MAIAVFLQFSCFYYPIALRRIYTIALYYYYLITLYHCYLIVSREDRPRALGSAAPHSAANSRSRYFRVVGFLKSQNYGVVLSSKSRLREQLHSATGHRTSPPLERSFLS